MTHFRLSILSAVGLLGLAFGLVGGCAEGTLVSAPSGNAGARSYGGTSGTVPTTSGATGFPISTAGTSDGGIASLGGSTSVTCEAGLKRCGPDCVDVTANPSHCGDCGLPCPAIARECIAGQCACPTETHAVCDGICSDLRSDLANCGTCGRTCGVGRVCSAGVCICDPAKGTTQCGTKCVDLMTDLTHCGACNETGTPACSATQVCSQGVCTSRCTDLETQCGTKCSTLKSDAANCGACGKACDATRTCTDGTCVCATGRKLCGSVCADPQTDSKNCGDCGKVCLPGTECSKGTCVCSANASSCPITSTGVAGASSVAGGAGNKSECVDLNSHPKHCGSCTKSCAASETCEAAKCVCQDPNVVCGTPATCTDLQTSNSHCGGCNQPCDTATQSCQAGICACKEGLTDCSGVCVDLTKSATNCGECAKACPTGQVCSASICVSRDVQISTKLQALPASATATKNSIIVSVRVCNQGTSTVNLGGAKITYWYSMDGAGDVQIAECVYASAPLSSTLVKVTAVDVLPVRSGGTDGSMVATLPTTATLASKACYDEIQLSVHAGANYIDGYVLANDWSYLGKTTYDVNQKVTLTLGGATMWGDEPPK